MRFVLFDPFHGAAGDMVVGALLDLGADPYLVRKAMTSVVAEPEFEIVDRAGIRAVRVESNAVEGVRTPGEVTDIIRRADAPQTAVDLALRVVRRLEAAERTVHGGEPVHFHEVGADDAIAEIVGACTALSSLDVAGVIVHQVGVGGGTVETSHGTLPVPAPATAAILEDAGVGVIFGEREDGELCTPTGAALLAEFSTLARKPSGGVRISGTGYGAGERNPPGIPNVLRAFLITSAERPSCDTVDILETNVDDVSGEVLAFTLSRLMEAGARDASAIPCVMKKGRPGILIRVICTADLSPSLSSLMARELGTLGVRCLPSVHRFIAERTTERVEVEIRGCRRTIPVRCGWIGESCYTLKAEFEDAKNLAEELGIPVREVTRAAEERGWEYVRRSPGDARHV